LKPLRPPARRPFEPIGDQARWRTIHATLCNLNVGDVITFDQMAAVLDLNLPAGKAALASAFRRAATEYQLANNRTLISVHGVGYRVAEPREQLTVARGHQRKAIKALDRGHTVVTHVDFATMDPDVRQAFEIVASGFARQKDINERAERRARRIEKALESIITDREHTEEDMAEMRRRLTRLEKRLDGDTVP
jgi:hypothetical protein